jgi:hypothetical protein
MKPITRYKRRAFLQGSSFALVLPFLETLAPRVARGQVIAAPKRFLTYIYPNGMWMAAWRPTGTGTTFTLGPAMGPMGRVFNDGLGAFPATEDGPGLDAVLSDIMVVSGLQNNHQVGIGDHTGGFAAFATDQVAPKTANAQMAGPSIDYVIAQKIGQQTARTQLAMAAQPLYPAGSMCDSGFSCAVSDHISFDATGTNLATFDNPGLTFNELFANGSPTGGAASAAAATQLRTLNKSILDLVTEEATSLTPQLSYQDRPRFAEYMSSVRQVEHNIVNATTGAGAMACTLPAAPTGAYALSNGRQSIDLVHQLIGLAFQCDATRVISLMWGNSVSQRPYDFIGASGGHHDNSHHGGNQTMINKLQRIDYWWFRRFSALISSLKALPDVDGRTILDNTLIFQGSDISDGDAHNHNDMPVVLAGGGAGFKMGQHLDFTTGGNANFNNTGQASSPPGNLAGHWYSELFISIAQGLGVPISTFGQNGKAPLAGLT